MSLSTELRRRRRHGAECRRRASRPDPATGGVVVELRRVRGGGRHRVDRPGRGERDRAPDDVRGRAGRVFKPFVGTLRRHGLKPSLAAGLIVLGLLAADDRRRGRDRPGRGRPDRRDRRLSHRRPGKAADQTDALGIDQEALDDARKAVEDAAPMITTGVLAGLVSGFGIIVAIAGGIILGALIMYYLLKDGTRLRRSVVDTGRPQLPRRGRRLHRRRLPHPARLRAGPHRHVGHRGGGRRPRRPPARPAARVHHRGRELHRRLHPLHRRVPRRRASP